MPQAYDTGVPWHRHLIQEHTAAEVYSFIRKTKDMKKVVDAFKKENPDVEWVQFETARRMVTSGSRSGSTSVDEFLGPLCHTCLSLHAVLSFFVTDGTRHYCKIYSFIKYHALLSSA